MGYPKSVLKKMKISLMSKSIQQLEDLLFQQEQKLKSLEKSNKETYEYLSFSINQKIKLIQDEINQRNKTKGMNSSI